MLQNQVVIISVIAALVCLICITISIRLQNNYEKQFVADRIDEAHFRLFRGMMAQEKIMEL